VLDSASEESEEEEVALSQTADDTERAEDRADESLPLLLVRSAAPAAFLLPLARLRLLLALLL